MAAGKVHLELLEQYRRLYLKARALSLAQVGRSGRGTRTTFTLPCAPWATASPSACSALTQGLPAAPAPPLPAACSPQRCPHAARLPLPARVTF